MLFCYWAVRELGYSMLEMAGLLKMSQPGVVYAVRRGERIANERNIKLRNWFTYFLSLVPFLFPYAVNSSCKCTTNSTGWIHQWSQVCFLDMFYFFSIFEIFLLSFLSLLILALTRLLAWDTPDSPIPKWVPISFSFAPVYLWQRNIFTLRPKAGSAPKTDPTESNIACRDAFSTNSFKAERSLSGFFPPKNLSFINEHSVKVLLRACQYQRVWYKSWN